MVLLKANELLPEQDASPVGHVVGRHVREILAPVPHVPSVELNSDASLQVEASAETHQHKAPEDTVLLVVVVAVVMHWVHRAAALEIVLVTRHEGLELDGVFTAHQVRVLVVVVQKVVHLRLVELARSTQCAATDRATARLGHATPVQAEMVHIVLFTLFSKLCLAFGGITSGRRSLHGSISGRIAEVGAFFFVKALFRLNGKVLGLFSPNEVVVDSRLADGQDREGLHNISEFFSVGLAADCRIRMVLLDQGTVRVLNLLRGRLLGHSKN